jgi:pimeloyl-ACP methyl ester carboxylesterase
MRDKSNWADGWFWSHDGLRLHYRDYPGDATRPALLCLPGLTRNARDFDALATRLSPEWRLITCDLRGRGESAYAKDTLTYVPLTYLQDIALLLEGAHIDRFAVIGTSLGGLLAMLLPVTHRNRIAGAVFNDIGPELEADGLARVRALVTRGGIWPTWLHAARELAARNAAIYPRWKLDDWLIFAHRLCRLNSAGRIELDFDAHIADPFRLPAPEGAADMWTALDAYADLPTLSLRGALSDIMTAQTQKAMAARLPKLRAVTVPNVGHAPTLDEPASIKAIEAFLAELVTKKQSVAAAG